MWVGGPIVITGSERNDSFRVTGRYSTDGIRCAGRGQELWVQVCLDTSGDKEEHSPLGSPGGTQSC